MNSSKVTECLSIEHEAASILMQTKSVFSKNECEKSSEKIQNQLEMKSAPKRVAAVKRIAKMRSFMKEALMPSKAKEGIKPAQVRGRPALSFIVVSLQPAKKAKMVPAEVMEKRTFPAPASFNDSSQITTTPSTSKRHSANKDNVAKWSAMRLNIINGNGAPSLRERGTMQTLRAFFKNQPKNRYQQ